MRILTLRHTQYLSPEASRAASGLVTESVRLNPMGCLARPSEEATSEPVCCCSSPGMVTCVASSPGLRYRRPGRASGGGGGSGRSRPTQDPPRPCRGATGRPQPGPRPVEMVRVNVSCQERTDAKKAGPASWERFPYHVSGKRSCANCHRPGETGVFLPQSTF